MFFFIIIIIYLNVVGRQVSLHVAVLLFGRGRGGLVSGWEVGPVKTAKRQHDTQHGKGRSSVSSLTFYTTLL